MATEVEKLDPLLEKNLEVTAQSIDNISSLYYTAKGDTFHSEPDSIVDTYDDDVLVEAQSNDQVSLTNNVEQNEKVSAQKHDKGSEEHIKEATCEEDNVALNVPEKVDPDVNVVDTEKLFRTDETENVICNPAATIIQTAADPGEVLEGESSKEVKLTDLISCTSIIMQAAAQESLQSDNLVNTDSTSIYDGHLLGKSKDTKNSITLNEEKTAIENSGVTQDQHLMLEKTIQSNPPRKNTDEVSDKGENLSNEFDTVIPVAAIESTLHEEDSKDEKPEEASDIRTDNKNPEDFKVKDKETNKGASDASPFKQLSAEEKIENIEEVSTSHDESEFSEQILDQDEVDSRLASVSMPKVSEAEVEDDFVEAQSGKHNNEIERVYTAKDINKMSEGKSSKDESTVTTAGTSAAEPTEKEKPRELSEVEIVEDSAPVEDGQEGRLANPPRDAAHEEIANPENANMQKDELSMIVEENSKENRIYCENTEKVADSLVDTYQYANDIEGGKEEESLNTTSVEETRGTINISIADSEPAQKLELVSATALEDKNSEGNEEQEPSKIEDSIVDESPKREVSEIIVQDLIKNAKDEPEENKDISNNSSVLTEENVCRANNDKHKEGKGSASEEQTYQTSDHESSIAREEKTDSESLQISSGSLLEDKDEEEIGKSSEIRTDKKNPDNVKVEDEETNKGTSDASKFTQLSAEEETEYIQEVSTSHDEGVFTKKVLDQDEVDTRLASMGMPKVLEAEADDGLDEAQSSNDENNITTEGVSLGEPSKKEKPQEFPEVKIVEDNASLEDGQEGRLENSPCDAGHEGNANHENENMHKEELSMNAEENFKENEGKCENIEKVADPLVDVYQDLGNDGVGDLPFEQEKAEETIHEDGRMQETTIISSSDDLHDSDKDNLDHKSQGSETENPKENRELISDKDNLDHKSQGSETENPKENPELILEGHPKNTVDEDLTNIDTSENTSEVHAAINAPSISQATTEEDADKAPDHIKALDNNEDHDRHTREAVVQVVQESSIGEDSRNVETTTPDDEVNHEKVAGVSYLNQMEGQRLSKENECDQGKHDLGLSEDSHISSEKTRTQESSGPALKKDKLEKETEYDPRSVSEKNMNVEDSVFLGDIEEDHLEKEEYLKSSYNPHDAHEEKNEDLQETVGEKHYVRKKEILKTQNTQDNILADVGGQRSKNAGMVSESEPEDKSFAQKEETGATGIEMSACNDTFSNMNIAIHEETATTNEMSGNSNEYKFVEDPVHEKVHEYSSDSLGEEKNHNMSNDKDMIKQEKGTDPEEANENISAINDDNKVHDTYARGQELVVETSIQKLIEEKRCMEEETTEETSIDEDKIESEILDKRNELEGKESSMAYVDAEICLDETNTRTSSGSTVQIVGMEDKLDNPSDVFEKTIMVEISASGQDVEEMDQLEEQEESFQEKAGGGMMFEDAATEMFIDKASFIAYTTHMEYAVAVEGSKEEESLNSITVGETCETINIDNIDGEPYQGSELVSAPALEDKDSEGNKKQETSKIEDSIADVSPKREQMSEITEQDLMKNPECEPTENKDTSNNSISSVLIEESVCCANNEKHREGEDSASEEQTYQTTPLLKDTSNHESNITHEEKTDNENLRISSGSLLEDKGQEGTVDIRIDNKNPEDIKVKDEETNKGTSDASPFTQLRAEEETENIEEASTSHDEGEFSEKVQNQDEVDTRLASMHMPKVLEAEAEDDLDEAKAQSDTHNDKTEGAFEAKNINTMSESKSSSDKHTVTTECISKAEPSKKENPQELSEVEIVEDSALVDDAQEDRLENPPSDACLEENANLENENICKEELSMITEENSKEIGKKYENVANSLEDKYQDLGNDGDLRLEQKKAEQTIQEDDRMQETGIISSNYDLHNPCKNNQEQVSQGSETQNLKDNCKLLFEGHKKKTVDGDLTNIDTSENTSEVHATINALPISQATTEEDINKAPNHINAMDNNEHHDRHTREAIVVVVNENNIHENYKNVENTNPEDEKNDEKAAGVSYMKQMEGEGLSKGNELDRGKNNLVSEGSHISPEKSKTEETSDYALGKDKLEDKTEYAPRQVSEKNINVEDSVFLGDIENDHLEKEEHFKSSYSPHDENEDMTEDLQKTIGEKHEGPNYVCEETFETQNTRDNILADVGGLKSENAEIVSESEPEVKSIEQTDETEATGIEMSNFDDNFSNTNIATHGETATANEMSVSSNENEFVQEATQEKVHENSTDTLCEEKNQIMINDKEMTEQETGSNPEAAHEHIYVINNDNEVHDTNAGGAELELEKDIQEIIEEKRCMEEETTEGTSIYEDKIESRILDKKNELEGQESSMASVDDEICLGETITGNTSGSTVQIVGSEDKLDNPFDVFEKKIKDEISASGQDAEEVNLLEKQEESFQEKTEVGMLFEDAATEMVIDKASSIAGVKHVETYGITEMNEDTETAKMKGKENLIEVIKESPDNHALVLPTSPDPIDEKHEAASKSVLEDQSCQNTNAEDKTEAGIAERIDSEVLDTIPEKMHGIAKVNEDTETVEMKGEENLIEAFKEYPNNHAPIFPTPPALIDEKHEEASESVLDQSCHYINAQDKAEVDIEKERIDSEMLDIIPEKIHGIVNMNKDTKTVGMNSKENLIEAFEEYRNNHPLVLPIPSDPIDKKDEEASKYALEEQHCQNTNAEGKTEADTKKEKADLEMADITPEKLEIPEIFDYSDDSATAMVKGEETLENSIPKTVVLVEKVTNNGVGEEHENDSHITNSEDNIDVDADKEKGNTNTLDVDSDVRLAEQTQVSLSKKGSMQVEQAQSLQNDVHCPITREMTNDVAPGSSIEDGVKEMSCEFENDEKLEITSISDNMNKEMLKPEKHLDRILEKSDDNKEENIADVDNEREMIVGEAKDANLANIVCEEREIHEEEIPATTFTGHNSKSQEVFDSIKTEATTKKVEENKSTTVLRFYETLVEMKSDKAQVLDDVSQTMKAKGQEDQAYSTAEGHNDDSNKLDLTEMEKNAKNQDENTNIILIPLEVDEVGEVDELGEVDKLGTASEKQESLEPKSKEVTTVNAEAMDTCPSKIKEPTMSAGVEHVSSQNEEKEKVTVTEAEVNVSDFVSQEKNDLKTDKIDSETMNINDINDREQQSSEAVSVKTNLEKAESEDPLHEVPKEIETTIGTENIHEDSIEKQSLEDDVQMERNKSVVESTIDREGDKPIHVSDEIKDESQYEEHKESKGKMVDVLSVSHELVEEPTKMETSKDQQMKHAGSNILEKDDGTSEGTITQNKEIPDTIKKLDANIQNNAKEHVQLEGHPSIMSDDLEIAKPKEHLEKNAETEEDVFRALIIASLRERTDYEQIKEEENLSSQHKEPETNWKPVIINTAPMDEAKICDNELAQVGPSVKIEKALSIDDEDLLKSLCASSPTENKQKVGEKFDKISEDKPEYTEEALNANEVDTEISKEKIGSTECPSEIEKPTCTDGSSESVPEIHVNDREVLSMKPCTISIMKPSENDIIEEDLQNLTEDSNSQLNEEEDGKGTASDEVTECKESSHNLSSTLEPEVHQPEEEREMEQEVESYAFVESVALQDEQMKQIDHHDLPVSRFLMDYILREGTLLDEASNVEAEDNNHEGNDGVAGAQNGVVSVSTSADKLSDETSVSKDSFSSKELQNTSENNESEDKMQEEDGEEKVCAKIHVEEILASPTPEQTTEETCITEDNAGHTNENSSPLVEENKISEANAKIEIPEVKDDEETQSNLHESFPSMAEAENVKEEMPSMSDESTLVPVNDDREPTSTEERSTVTKMDIEECMIPTLVQDEKVEETVLEICTVEQTINTSVEALNKGVNLSSVGEGSHEDNLREEEKAIPEDVQNSDKTSYALTEGIFPLTAESDGKTKASVDNKETLPNPTYDQDGKLSHPSNLRDDVTGPTLENDTKVTKVETEDKNSDESTEIHIQEEKNESEEVIDPSEPEAIEQPILAVESTDQTPEVTENLLEKRILTVSLDEKEAVHEDKYEGAKDEHKPEGIGQDGVVVKEARDADLKPVHKKSHSILSGVGSKVIAKMKKAIACSPPTQRHHRMN